MSRQAANVSAWLFRVLAHPLTGNISILEALALFLCGATVLGVALNGYDIYQERNRAERRNGARLVLVRGAWRRVMADSVKALAFTGLAVISSIAPPSTNPGPQTRQAGITFILLAVIIALLFNQANDFFTRKAAERLYNQEWDRRQTPPRVDD